MRSRGTVIALIALALVSVVAPAVALADTCPEDEADDCCIPCETICGCCATLPRIALASGAPAADPGLASGRVDLGPLGALPTPTPRDILHVPKLASI